MQWSLLQCPTWPSVSISPISTAELERRWGAVRAAMAAQKIDVLVMQNSNEFSGGYVKWFTDMPSGNGIDDDGDRSRRTT